MASSTRNCQSSQGLLSPILARWRVAKARPYLTGRRTLDYGCGNGGLALFCPADKYFGVDISPAAVETARALHPDYTFEVELPRDGAFDVAVMLAVLEHVPNPARLVADILRRLEPGGLLVATTPSPRAHAVHEFGARLGLFSADAAEQHETFLDKPRITDIVKQSGGRLVKFERFMFGLNQLFVVERP